MRDKILIISPFVIFTVLSILEFFYFDFDLVTLIVCIVLNLLLSLTLISYYTLFALFNCGDDSINYLCKPRRTRKALPMASIITMPIVLSPYYTFKYFTVVRKF